MKLLHGCFWGGAGSFAARGPSPPPLWDRRVALGFGLKRTQRTYFHQNFNRGWRGFHGFDFGYPRMNANRTKGFLSRKHGSGNCETRARPRPQSQRFCLRLPCGERHPRRRTGAKGRKLTPPEQWDSETAKHRRSRRFAVESLMFTRNPFSDGVQLNATRTLTRPRRKTRQSGDWRSRGDAQISMHQPWVSAISPYWMPVMRR